MAELLHSVLAILILAIVIWIINKPIRRGLKKIVCSKAVSKVVLKILIFTAEHKRAFKPPGSGPQKKEWVKQKYDRWVTTADDAVDSAIDFIVAALNTRKTTYKATATTQVGKIPKAILDEAFNSAESSTDTDDGNETELTSESDTSVDAVG